MSKRLFPLPNIALSDNSYSPSPWSVLSMYELALRVGLLGQAGKFLTLCCSSDILGGLDSRPGAARALVITVELLYQNIRRMSVKSSLEVLQFIFRLEEMLGCHADELLGVIDFSDTIPGYSGSLCIAEIPSLDLIASIDSTDHGVGGVVSAADCTTVSPSVQSVQDSDSTTTPNGSIGSIISAPARSFGIYSGAGNIIKIFQQLQSIYE